eukprot:GDKI01000069.1.p1 GENE.GDKI01000069.1~~GDKI01000069.1.p1  ORF type:complete len:127 (-),score=4.68 GDKI01000069.1:149-529(-)
MCVSISLMGALMCVFKCVHHCVFLCVFTHLLLGGCMCARDLFVSHSTGPCGNDEHGGYGICRVGDLADFSTRPNSIVSCVRAYFLACVLTCSFQKNLLTSIACAFTCMCTHPFLSVFVARSSDPSG